MRAVRCPQVLSDALQLKVHPEDGSRAVSALKDVVASTYYDGSIVERLVGIAMRQAWAFGHILQFAC